MLKVGQIERVEITGYSSEGMGVCRIEGCAVFVPNAIRGEICDVKVTHVSRNSAHGKIEQIHLRSPHRIPRACPDAKLCGGCQLHHMDYEEELSFKAQKVYDALTRLGGVEFEAAGKAFPLGGRCPSAHTGADEGTSDEAPSPVAPAICRPNSVPITGAADIGGYRNKAQYPLAVKNGRPIAGFYKNRTHEVVPIRRCAILPEVFDRVKDVVLRWAEEDRISVYDETTGQGLLRHIYVRRGAVSGQIMVCLVVNGDGLPRENRLIHALRREIPGLASLVISANRRNTNVVLGDEFRTLWGQDWIEDELCGFTFRLSPRSFYQVNHDQAQRLYERAVALAELHGTETVLDLYCGTGTITLALSRKAGRAVGVEVVPEAIEDARQNAARNGVKNVEFFCADASVAAERFCGETNACRDGTLPSAPPQAEIEASGIRYQASGDALQSPPPGGKVSPQATDEGKPDAAACTKQQVPGNDQNPSIVHCQLSTVNCPDVILVDPPRKGLAPEVVEAMAKMAPERIVYVSCDPATLARDVKLLTQRGYALTHAEAFDLFPRTFHVETVVLMMRNE